MNWRQARGDGTAEFNITAYYWFGGLLLTLGGLLLTLGGLGEVSEGSELL